MFVNNVEVLNMARAKAAHAAARQGMIARNVAHADTPGYRARDLPSFADVWRSQGAAMKATRDRHLQDATLARLRPQQVAGHMKPNGNSVSIEAQMVRAAEARMDHDLALATHRSLSGNIRSVLGRR